MNRLSSARSPYRPDPKGALLFLFFATLPGTALAQDSVTTPPAVPSPALVVPPALAQNEALSQREMLAQDSRLDRGISLDVISVPLGEVLRKESLDKSTETMEDGHRFLLTAAPDCADLKLQVRLNNRPLRTLMTALAEMLPGAWTRTPHGYQLAMTKKAVNARTEWWRLFLGEREKAMALQRQAVLSAMQTKGYRRRSSDADPEQSDLAAETEIADQHDFFYSLPPELKSQIAANMEESGFYGMDGMGAGNEGEQSGVIGWLGQMSPQTQEKFKAAMQANVSRLALTPPALQGYAVQAQKDVSAFNPSKVYFWFQNAGFSVIASPVNGPPSVSSALDLNVPSTTSVPLLMLNQAPLARVVQKIGEAAPEEWKRLAAYQHSRVWPNVLPKLPPEDDTTYHPAISRAGQTDWLGQSGHMEYVCDYYSRGGYEMPEAQKKEPVKRLVTVELDEMAARRDISWVKDADGITLVRNNRWYRDDALEVPEPLLRRWFGMLLQTRRQEAARQQETVAQAGRQSPEERSATLKQIWDWAAEVTSTLTPWQIRNGLLLFQPEEKDLAPRNDATAAKLLQKLKHYAAPPGEVVPTDSDAFAEATRMPPFYGTATMLKGFPHTAQLYGSLGDEGRTALLAGRLPASALSATQLAQAVSLQPSLPQAMQNFPPTSVLVGLLCPWQNSTRISFGQVPRMRLVVSTPPASQNAP